MKPVTAINHAAFPATVIFRACAQEAPRQPAWLEELSRQDSPRWCVVRARIRGAAAMDDLDFMRATAAAYTEIARRLAESAAPHPARIWNYIPDILRPCAGGIDRYRVFNSARYEACRSWFGKIAGSDTFHQRLPTASAVGHEGGDLVIDALGTDVQGVAVENPRQIAAYRYSPRYGPRPPCFTRAMKIPGRAGEKAQLLIGGTASVRGEDSVHESDCVAQLEETLRNLASLLRAARGRPHDPPEIDRELKSFRELRVYHPRRVKRALIARLVRRRFGRAVHIEQSEADLCRRELLVEIEGIAAIDPMDD